MRQNARAWAAAGLVSVVLVAMLVWHSVFPTGPVGDASVPGGAGAASDAGRHMPQSEVLVLDPLVPPVPTAVPGTVSVVAGSGAQAGKTLVSWELAFPRGVWSLHFVLGSPDVELSFLDLSRAVSEDCHELSAITDRGPAPFPAARFDATTRTVTLADMPLEVVEALTRARDLTLVACDTRFTLDDTQQRVLIDFYVQSAGVILDAVSADAGTASAPPDDGRRAP